MNGITMNVEGPTRGPILPDGPERQPLGHFGLPADRYGVDIGVDLVRLFVERQFRLRAERHDPGQAA